MQHKTTVVAIGGLVLGLGLLGWQSWNTHQLQQQVIGLQQQLAQVQAAPGTMPAAPPPALAAPTPSLPPSGNVAPLPPAGGSTPLNPPGAADPLWGSQDPFAQVQQMQQQMHQRMQQLMEGFGMGDLASPFFDMEPFQGALGFGSSMGFGAQPNFAFSEKPDRYELTISIPAGSNVEINTSVNGRDLTVEGKVTVDSNQQGSGSAFRSMQTQQFARTITLPDDVDPLGITNVTQGDKVVITVPKATSGQQRSGGISVL